jgi:outer membrane immunogenic protein
MMKWMWVGALLCGVATVAGAQESRKDVSVSGIGIFAPDVNGGVVHPMTTTTTLGFLGSGRYMLTPRSALELNYAWAQNSTKYNSASFGPGRVHTRQQEITAAYVYSRTYRNYTPFVEAGVGGMFFSPIRDNGTNNVDAKQQLRPGGLFGAGLAYEISPSFDIRTEFRGFVARAPDFNVPNSVFTTNRYYVTFSPSIGVAYHF